MTSAESGGMTPFLDKLRPKAMLGFEISSREIGKIAVRGQSAFRRTAFPLSGEREVEGRSRKSC